MRPQSEAKRQSGSERAERGPPDKGRPPCQRMVTALEMLVVLGVLCPVGGAGGWPGGDPGGPGSDPKDFGVVGCGVGEGRGPGGATASPRG